MSKFFVYLYEWFGEHKKIFYAVLIFSVALFAFMASQITLQENITNFFNSSDKNKNEVFQNVKAKDKIVVMLSGTSPDDIIASAEIFEAEVESLLEEGLINSITAYADEEVVAQCTSFIYDYLPIFMTEEDYEKLEAKINEEGVSQTVGSVYNNLVSSPQGMFVGDIVMQDPFNMGTPLLQKFEQFNPNVQYQIYEGRLFTEDLSTMLMFIDPHNSMGDTGNNDELVTRIEEAQEKAGINGVKVDCIGGPIVAVYNARQIKMDTAITLTIAMVFILLVIYLSFRNKWSILLITIPPGFGALFALAMVWLVQGEISAIAIGAGTVVLGISLSYSIHIVSHLNHISSPKKIIEELTAPLTIGCFTTIGAFAALIFTSSELLQDMGLFSVFALIGTTLFCLIFLPQFLTGYREKGKSKLLNRIENIAGYRFDNNKWVVFPLLIITVVTLFYYQKVEFDGDMSNINYAPEHIVEAENRSTEILGDKSNDVYIVTGGNELNTLAEEYLELEKRLNEFKQSNMIDNVVTVSEFIIPIKEQERRIERWNNFWSENRENTLALMAESAREYGFNEGAFAAFQETITREYEPCGYSQEEIGDIPIISEWITSSENATSLLCRITISKENKAEVYENIDELDNTAVIDRAYFSSLMAEATSNDFNYILFVSSLIVFIALLLSYGRLELTLLTFLPMAISWVIILGFMVLLDIKFNVVNIILATFIFGIGDDFSIFIMDGLLQEYKNGRKVLGAHKTAIFFSAFTAIVGIGVLIFAQHPALKSIATISVLGLSVVVFVSYTIQPMLFRLFVNSQTERGGFPYTLGSILNTLYCFIYFLIGCILIHLFMLVVIVLPMKKRKKKLALHYVIYWFAKFFLKTMITAKTVHFNHHKESYDKPAVIIANHQSFIDILLLLSLSPKIIMVTNSWVWHSPFFGWIIRYADFQHAADGYDALAGRLEERVKEGYSIVIFPEGTRSADCSIQRFYKGAFYLAHLLKLDILPILIYGAGQISSKKQGFYIKSGIVATKTMPRMEYGNTAMGETYQEQAKEYRKWYVEQYALLNDELGRTSNPYFRDALMKNYIYKGPVLEWYMRIKCRIDGYYDLWDKLLPRNAAITDVGCGYGQMAFMLGMLSNNRRIVGIDYDTDKIETAQHSFLSKRCNVTFECADMRSCTIPPSDAILFNDSLHYVDADGQREILLKAVASLNEGGMIVVRDGDCSRKDKHGKIEQTEVWSTEIIKFNKTSQPLTFVDAQWMQDFAQAHGLHIKVRHCDKDSSETLYILTHSK